MSKDNFIRIIGIDPGTVTIGFSVLEIDPCSLDIERSYAYTFNASLMYVRNRDFEELHGARLSHLFTIREEFKGLLERIKPVSVGSEAPFYFSKRPGAYAPLVETLLMLRLELLSYHPDYTLHTYDPSSVKNSVKAKGNSDKDAMRLAVSRLTDIRLSGDYNRLDEHAIDALAVGYCHYKRTILGIEK